MNLNYKVQEFQKQHINLNRFLFIWKEPHLHNNAFLHRTSLKLGVIISSIFNLVFSTLIINSLFRKPFLFSLFVAYFPYALLLNVGSIFLLISLEHLQEMRSTWGYILTATALWYQVSLQFLIYLFSFIFGYDMYTGSIILNLLIFLLTLAITGYLVWINYCYAKHISLGNGDVVESGRGEKLVDNEGGPGVEKTSKISPEISTGREPVGQEKIEPKL